jgi:hypothetical protein
VLEACLEIFLCLGLQDYDYVRYQVDRLSTTEELIHSFFSAGYLYCLILMCQCWQIAAVFLSSV